MQSPRLPPHKENSSMAQALIRNIMGYCTCERRCFDVNTKAVTMETTWFKSLPDAKAPDLHVSTNFHRTLSILDILNSNMAEFILRKYVISPIIHKTENAKLWKICNNPYKICTWCNFSFILSFSYFLALWQDYFPWNFECYSFNIDTSEEAQACIR